MRMKAVEKYQKMRQFTENNIFSCWKMAKTWYLKEIVKFFSIHFIKRSIVQRVAALVSACNTHSAMSLGSIPTQAYLFCECESVFPDWNCSAAAMVRDTLLEEP